MNIKPRTNYLLIIGALIVGLVTFAILASESNRPKPTSAADAPSVGLLETSGNKLIVHAKSSNKTTTETFVYCLTRESSANTCDWGNADEFDLTEAGDYYVYVKSIATDKISEPKLFTYEPIDISNVKL